MTDAMGIKMYGPTRWAAMKNTGAPALGWTWSDVGSGIINIGKTGLSWWSGAQQTAQYKAAAEAAAKSQTEFFQNALKWGAIIGIGIIAANALKKA